MPDITLDFADDIAEAFDDDAPPEPESLITCSSCGEQAADEDDEHFDSSDHRRRVEGSETCVTCVVSRIEDHQFYCDGCSEYHITEDHVHDTARFFGISYSDVADIADEEVGIDLRDSYLIDRNHGFTFCNARWEEGECYECGGPVDYDDVHDRTDSDGDVFCSNCRGDDAYDDSGSLDDWNHVPDLQFHYLEPDGTDQAVRRHLKPSGVPFLGVEVEMEQASDLVRQAREMFPEGLAWFMHDGSLDGSGVEMATHPGTFDWFMAHFPWDNLQALADLGARSYHRERCGIHVHISADAFSHAHLFKFLAFHYRNPAICQAIGQRGTAQYSSWSQWLATRPDIVKFAKKQGKPSTRYMAVNLTESETIELRYFRGNLAPARVRKNLQWVQALYEYTATVPAVDTEVGLTFAAMLPWLKDRRDRFPDLVDFIEKREMTRPETVDQHEPSVDL